MYRMSLILKIWSVDQSKKKLILLKKDEDFVTKGKIIICYLINR